MLMPGETALHTFSVPFALTDISKIIVTYKQENQVVFEKEITSESEDVSFQTANDKTTFSFRLTQEQSLLFAENSLCNIQLNVLTTGGTRAVSNVIKGSVGSQYVKKVI